MSISELHKRDDGICFYCAKALTVEESTQEHMLATTHGGSNNNNNLVLACQPCNTEAGAKFVIAKVRLRELKRLHRPSEVPAPTPARVKINGVLIEVL